jgi:hypothetical protein
VDRKRSDRTCVGYANDMGYVIAGILVLLIVAAGVTVLVLNATRRQRRASATDSEYGEGTPGSDMAIVAADENTPLGDTDQHAGEQTREGETVGGQDADRSGGTGRPVTSGEAKTGAPGEPRREHGGTAAGGEGGVGGEAEGGRPVMPESERLANRPR